MLPHSVINSDLTDIYLNENLPSCVVIVCPLTVGKIAIEKNSTKLCTKDYFNMCAHHLLTHNL